jgi:CHAT domain-containing protein
LVPFETLQDGNGRYLIDQYEFTYLASARSLLDGLPETPADELASDGQEHAFLPRFVLADLGAAPEEATSSQPTQKKDRAEMLVFGGVDYGAIEDDGAGDRSEAWLTESVENTLWRPLAQTAEEVDFIQSRLDVSEEYVHRSDRATETQLLQTPSPKRMHIATHGFFFESQITWLLDDAQAAALTDEFLDRLFPNTRSHEAFEDNAESSVAGRLLSRSNVGRTVLDVRRTSLRYENRVQQANAFLDDLENLPKRKSEIKMDLLRWSNPLIRSGLVLADRNRIVRDRAAFDGDRLSAFAGTDDGLATAYEISWMDLRTTDLVVLSACETGLGDIVTGEGVYGLGRSFQTAGAKSVIMSLWQVDDAATRDLMTTFYDSLDEGATHQAALRQAALSVRASQPHPYFWGPFVAMGRVNDAQP